MKELLGHVPTYNPNSLAYNERSDFTRRIPTGLSGKQMNRDSKIASQIAYARSEEQILDIFKRKARLLSNPRYWEVMRTVWVAAGSTETADLFRQFMKSSRPCRSWFMTKEDAEYLDSLEFPVTVWRAYDAVQYPDDSDPGISWTLDREWCYGYAEMKGRVVKERKVCRDDVFAYVSRRGESEIIIL